MKKIIGILITLLVVAFVGIIILRVWGITIISLDSILKSGLTLILLGALIVVLLIAYGFFFRNKRAGYNKNTEGKAQPKL
ncbi:hypothetical protein [Pedobacter nototheniae]|uniref:hypothetical protein n=1 Tax=Pedobacter nototheniae TaxID=2488994 RepID=UPI00292E7A84|nr:hypothetical protein [Pedobacter nototheniae]